MIGILTGVVGCVTRIGFRAPPDATFFSCFFAVDLVGAVSDCVEVEVEVEDDEDGDVISVEDDDDAVGAIVLSSSPPPPTFLFCWLQRSPAPASRNHGGRGILVVDADLLVQA